MEEEFEFVEFKDNQAPSINANFLNGLQNYIKNNSGSGSFGSVKIQTDRITLVAGTNIINGYEITLPINYIVGNNSLALYWNGERLIKATSTEDGNYKEVGIVGSLSNKITMYRTESDGNYILLENVILEEIVISATDDKNSTLIDNIYSTEETIIGKWINGKNVYRKVIDFGQLPNNADKSVTTGLNNVNYINMYGFATNGTQYFPLNLIRIGTTNQNYEISSYINNNSILISTGVDRSTFTAIIVLEYTKSTD